VRDILEAVNTTKRAPREEPVHVEFESSILAPEAWLRRKIETELSLTLPLPLCELWDLASSLRLFVDITYGQWGLIVLPPARAVEFTVRQFSLYEEKMRKGDLVIGEFLGDTELVILRCDRAEEDFGKVLIFLPLDPRADWPCVGNSFDEFLRRYVENRGSKYWESW